MVHSLSVALHPLLPQLGLPDGGSDVGFLLSGVISLVGIVAVAVFLFYVARRGWRHIAETVRFDRRRDD